MADISVRREGRAGRITLTRPTALNALSSEMAREIAAALECWRDDADVALVMIDAEGERAFSAGGDIQEIYEAGRAGRYGYARSFWAEEYQLNLAISRYPKPYVAFCHGFVMGGGVGVSIHGSNRIVGESTKVAMPECAIGLVPDVGGSALLAAAPGHLGEYLGLTGHRMGSGDALLADFADHFIPEEEWPALKARLIEAGDADAVEQAEQAPQAGDLTELRGRIDAAFSADDLASVVHRLEAEGEWGAEILATMQRNSPLSMACTLELVRAARAEPGLDEALAREFRFVWRSQSEGELTEGIRAAVIDKDRAPRWKHELRGVPAGEVAAMLAPLGADEWRAAA